jgi:hypothetical protein
MAADVTSLPAPDLPRPNSTMVMAYGGGGQGSNTEGKFPYVYRVERGFPFQRRGQPVVVDSQFNSLALPTGSAVGLHSPVSTSALTGNELDPSKSGFLQKGSNVPTFITVPFTFNATSTTALTISWPATALRRANRTLTAASDTAIPAGSISVTGLTANTTYYYYPFWSEAAKIVGWAGAGNATSAGNPAIAQTLQSDLVLQQQSYQGFVPLNTLQYTQPAAGTSTATGGYGTGNQNITGGGRSYRIL